MVVISSREFRQNQKAYFDKVDSGEQVIVQRGKDKAYALTPINDEDIYFNSNMIEKLKVSLQEAAKGEVQKLTNAKDVSEFLGL